MLKAEQRCIDDAGKPFVHREPPSRRLSKAKVVMVRSGVGESEAEWENCTYYGLLRRYASGFPIGGGPWAVISLTARDETARQSWREFQQVKTDLVGEGWEAVELYPAEDRLVDPSNRFYLWCAPKGVFCFGLPDAGRKVLAPGRATAPQRPFPSEPAHAPS